MIPPVQTVYRHPPEQLGHWGGGQGGGVRGKYCVEYIKIGQSKHKLRALEDSMEF